MSTFLRQVGDTYNVKIEYYECDTETDKSNFDTSSLETGTQILVYETGKTYILNSQKQWKETT